MRKKTSCVLLLMTASAVAMFLISFCVGRYSMAPDEFLKTLFFHFSDPSMIRDPNTETVLFNIRLPRVLAVILCGSGLSVAGAAYQGMFKNPLVSPDILGAAAGSGFGASMALLLGFSMGMVQFCSFFGGLIAVFVAVNINRRVFYDPLLGLVLGGMMVSTVFQSGISMVKFLADADDLLPSITFWLMGSFSSITKYDLKILAPLIIAGCIIILLMGRRLNIMSFGEEEARTLGVNPRTTRMVVISAATVITAASVSVCGLIGWIGLVVPHFCRSLVGPNFRILLPASAVTGATYLLLVDTVVRTAWSVELPIGVLTSLLGVPVFFVIFRKNSGGRNEC
ncbi:MAG: FecCD family ABC transporter permease [Anaerovoracaceae bacterium]